MKKAIIKGAIISGAGIAFGFAVWCLFNTVFFNDRNFLKIDKDADLIIVYANNEINDEPPKKCIVITDKSEIKEYLSAYKWTSDHLMCDGDQEYTVAAIKDDNVLTTVYAFEHSVEKYNTELVRKTNDYIERFKSATDFSYKYTMHAPLSINYENLKRELQNSEGFYVFSNSSEPKYSLFILEYTDQENDYERIDSGSPIYKYKLGEFEPDNIFIPIVESLKEDGFYVTNSNTRSIVYGTDGLFTRSINIYVSKVLDEETVEKYRNMWSTATKYEPHFMANGNGFGYAIPETYDFTIISEHKLDEQEIEGLNQKYSIALNK